MLKYIFTIITIIITSPTQFTEEVPIQNIEEEKMIIMMLIAAFRVIKIDV